jgi:hypothetical protein
MTFPFFFIVAHIEFYFIVPIAFFECRSIQNSQYKVRSLVVGHQASKTHVGGLDALLDNCEARTLPSFHRLIQFFLFFLKPENLTQGASVKIWGKRRLHIEIAWVKSQS